MANITGNQNPKVGEDAFYTVNDFAALTNFNNKYEWYLFKKQKSGSWLDITTEVKKGKTVKYKFGEICLGVKMKLVVYETKLSLLQTKPIKTKMAEYDLVPRSSKKPQILKVVLFNRGAKDPNKADYKDSLIAQAHCIGLFDQTIEFNLWEDDAKDGGHNAEINKNNKAPKSYYAKVNENGIAEVKISLLADANVLKQIANKYLMSGDKSEGANHEYYVTATYLGKIQGASQVNVLVTNPDNKTSTPQQPNNSAPKFPVGKGSVKQPDTTGKIRDAYFVNDAGQKISRIIVGQHIKVRIHTTNMDNKHLQYVIWEYDAGKNDEVYRSGRIKVLGSVIDTGGFTVSKAIFEKGIDLSLVNVDPDKEKQNYFIEIIPLDISADSSKFGVTDEGLLTVEKTKSPSMVKEQSKPTTIDKKECFCNKDFEEKDVKNLVKLLKGSETIWEGQALKGGKRAPCNISDKSISTLTKELNNTLRKYKINTCAQKMHFLAQVCEETGVFALSEETKSKYASSQSVYKGRGILQLTGVKNDNEKYYDRPGPYKSYADYKGNQNIIKTPQVVANDVKYAIDSGGWIWSINQKMTDNPKSDAIKRWGTETLGKSLNELAVYVDKYLELISVLLNGRGSDGMPIGWGKRKSYYNLLKTIFFKYDWYHGNKKDTPVNAKDIITYHIYADGKIERHIPKIIKSGYEKKYKYVYHDSNDKKYDVCIVDWIEIDKVKHIGKSTIEKGYTSHETFNVKGVNQKHVYKYSNGNIIASGDAGEGGGTITRKYAKAGGKTIIIKVPEPLLYNSGNVKVDLKFENTIRTYMGRDHFAALIGALADSNLSLVSEGSAMKDGTCFPSITHTNGESIDTDYLSLTNTQKYINSMAKFGFKSMLYKPGMKLKKPTGVTTFKEDAHHKAHLHCGSPSIKIEEIKE